MSAASAQHQDISGFLGALLRLHAEKRYQRVKPDAEGRYESAVLTGLCINGGTGKLHTPAPLAAYLEPSPWVDFEHSEVQLHLAAHPCDGRLAQEVIRADFEFVRDQVAHSWDIQSRRVTGRASEVLRHREGICYAKSHLLAALLRARGIPAGFCYQKLTLGDTPESGHCVHALNAVWLASRQTWIRLDARGNKPNVDAQFSMAEERLAFVVRPECGEVDYGIVHAEPPPKITQTLEAHEDCRVMYAHYLPTEL